MPKKIKIVNVNDDATYTDITDAVVENEKEENEPARFSPNVSNNCDMPGNRG